MKETKPRTIKELMLAIVKNAKEIVKAQRELDEVYGIQLIDGFRTGVGKKPPIEIQVHRGIDDIIEAMELESYDEPRTLGFKPRRQTKIRGVNIFQLAEEKEYYYKRAKQREGKQ